MVMEANRMDKKVVTTTIVHMDTIATVKLVEDPASTKTDEVEENIAAGIIKVAIVDMEAAEAIKSANTEMTTEVKEDTMTSQDTITEIEAMEEVTSIMKTRKLIVALAAIEVTIVTGATERAVGMAATGTIEAIVDMVVAATNAGMEVAFCKNSLSTSLTKIRSTPTQTTDNSTKTTQLSLAKSSSKKRLLSTSKFIFSKVRIASNLTSVKIGSLHKTTLRNLRLSRFICSL